MKKLTALALAGVLVLGLAGCYQRGTADEPENVGPGGLDSRQVEETYIKLSDGRTLFCVAYGGPHGGISCDWDHLVTQ